MGAPKFYHPNNPPEFSLSLIEDSPFTIILMRYINIAYSHFNYINNSGDSWLMNMNDKEKYLYNIFCLYRSIRSCLESIDLASKFISKYNDKTYTSDEIPLYTYAVYHYDLLCYKVSTLKDLYFKLINLIYELNLERCDWTNINRCKTLINNSALFNTLERFHSFSDNLKKLRNASAHDGNLFPPELKNIYLFQSALKACEMSPHDFNSIYYEQYKRGTDAYKTEILKLKKELLSQINIHWSACVSSTMHLFCFLSHGLLSLIIKLFPSMKDSFDSICTEYFNANH